MLCVFSGIQAKHLPVELGDVHDEHRVHGLIPGHRVRAGARARAGSVVVLAKLKKTKVKFI